jgi:hypothetical protein
MAHATVIANTDAAAIGASDVLVYRRASGGQFVLTCPADPGTAGDLLLDDEPLVCRALGGHVIRLAADEPLRICAGYIARSAAIVAVDCDVIVVLGRRDGCLAGVGDDVLVRAAMAAAANFDGRR